MVFDISQVPQGGGVTEVAEGNWNSRYPGTNQANYPFDSTSRDGCGPYDCNLFVHSMGVKPDGSVTYLALKARTLPRPRHKRHRGKQGRPGHRVVAQQQTDHRPDEPAGLAAESARPDRGAKMSLPMTARG